MDVGIRLPSFLVKDKTYQHMDDTEDHSYNNIPLLQKARAMLNEFKAFVQDDEYPKASSLYEGAKNLREQATRHMLQGKRLVHKQEWTVQQLDQEMTALITQQQPVWERLIREAALQAERFHTVYQRLVEVENELHQQASGSNSNDGRESVLQKILGSGKQITSEQEMIRHVYHHELLPEFKEAKMERQKLVGYPDGLLTQVKLILHRVEQDFEMTGKEMHDVAATRQQSRSGAGASLFPHLTNTTTVAVVRSTEEQVPQVIQNARAVLDAFKAFVQDDEYPTATSLYEHAKALCEDATKHIAHGKHLVHKKEWRLDQFDQDMRMIQERQQPIWEKLTHAAEQETERFKAMYDKVCQVETEVKHARGEGLEVAWMGLATPEQQTVRRVYRYELHHAFHDAKQEMQQMVGFPDGLLTEVHLIQRRVQKLIEESMDDIHKNPSGSFLHMMVH